MSRICLVHLVPAFLSRWTGKLTTGQLTAAYRMRYRDGQEWVGRRQTVKVNATLVGHGSTQRSQYSGEEWEGHCLVWGYEDRSIRREAVATGSLSGDVAKSLGRTRDSSLNGKSAVAEGDCLLHRQPRNADPHVPTEEPASGIHVRVFW